MLPFINPASMNPWEEDASVGYAVGVVGSMVMVVGAGIEVWVHGHFPRLCAGGSERSCRGEQSAGECVLGIDRCGVFKRRRQRLGWFTEVVVEAMLVEWHRGSGSREHLGVYVSGCSRRYRSGTSVE